MLTRTLLNYVNPVNDIYECFQIVCADTTHVLIKNIKQACFHLESTLSPIKPLPDLMNKEFKMNLHSICVVLMIFSFTEANAVTPVKELDITKYLGLWYEVS